MLAISAANATRPRQNRNKTPSQASVRSGRCKKR